MLRQLYDWIIRLAQSRRAPHALAAVSFTESSFFPLPPDVMLVPMVLADRSKAWRYALICTTASVAGGIFGYFIGYMLYDTLGKWLMGLYGYSDKIEDFRKMYQEWGHWIILIKGLTPIPYKIVTIASGLASYDFAAFVILSIITRAWRFYLVSGLIYFFGEPIREFIERQLGLTLLVLLVSLVAGFAVIKYFF